MSNAKANILNRLRSAGERAQLDANVPETQDYPFKEITGDLAQNFKQALETISGQCFIVDSELAFEAKLQDLLRNKEHVYATDAAYDDLSLIEGISIIKGQIPSDIEPFTLSYCEVLSARTGSVFVSSVTSEGRKLHAFADTHIVVASADQLVADLPGAMAILRAKYKDGFPSTVTLITGQSRTADIEKTLILGAHGPKNLIVIIKNY